MLWRHSFNVGTGRELGRASGARGVGSRKIWWETLLCLYLWPLLWPTFCPQHVSPGVQPCLEKGFLTDLATGEVANDVGWYLKAPLPFSVKTLPWLPALSSDIGLYCEETLVSVGLNGFADDGGGNAGAEP